MAPKLPERYQTHVRLGRDGDVEEWLATDTSLDRPVLLRVLDVDAAAERRIQYVAAVRAAAAAHHQHLVEVYAVGDERQPYAVLEWHGGVTIADRLNAGQPLAVDDFLPNAAGLASGLAAMHAAGTIHGGIDASAVGYGAGQAAKLGAFGRLPDGTADRIADTMALAATLRVSIAGEHGDSVGPSQIAEGIPVEVDAVLAEAEAGHISAAHLSASLASAPPPATPGGFRWSWGWLAAVIAIVIAGLVISAAGFALEFDEESPFLFPAAPSPTASTAAPAASTTTAPPSTPDEITQDAVIYDPFGDDTEREEDLDRLSDGNVATGWRTERYFRPLHDIKPGVGVVFTTSDDPAAVVVQGTSGIAYEWKWAGEIPDDFDEWGHVARASLLAGQNPTQLPSREGGNWLLWLTDLPEDTAGEFIGEITVVRFLP